MLAAGLGSAGKMRESFSRRDNKGEHGENTYTQRKKGPEESTARNSTDHFGGWFGFFTIGMQCSPFIQIN